MKVLLVDDHPMFRSGLARRIETVSRRPLRLQAGDGAHGLAMIRGHGDIGLALVDLGLPGDPDGFGLVREARRLRPKLPVAVISGSEGDDIVRSVKAAGATAFLPKSASAARIIDTLERHMPADAFPPKPRPSAGTFPGASKPKASQPGRSRCSRSFARGAATRRSARRSDWPRRR